MKIAEKTFPIITGTAGVKKSLTLRNELTNEKEEMFEDKGEEWEGYE